MRIMDEGDFDDYWTSALPYAWIAVWRPIAAMSISPANW